MAGDALARQEIRLARAQIRNEMRFPLWLTLIVGLGLVVSGALQASDLDSWLMWMSGAALIALSLGMWFAFDWARVAYGILGAVICAVFLVEFAVRRPPISLDAIIKGFQVLFWGWIALYAFLPSTRRLFAKAKGAAAKHA
jgi:hypothetical protein